MMIMIYISLRPAARCGAAGVGETGAGLSGRGLRHVQQNNVDVVIIIGTRVHTHTHTHTRTQRYIWKTNIGKKINQV